MPQVPLAHVVVATWGRLQTVPQAPQLLVVERLVSQPFEASPSQFAKPELQMIPHAPWMHVGAPFADEQVLPQEPQFLTSEVSRTSQPLLLLPSQLALFGAQVRMQLPPTQEAVPPPIGQMRPQAPQLEVSPAVLVSQPSLAMPLQSAKPAKQEPKEHQRKEQDPTSHI
jgi:hypothetical protein